MPKDIYAADPATVAMAAKFLEAVALPNLLKLGFETLGDADDNPPPWLRFVLFFHFSQYNEETQ